MFCSRQNPCQVTLFKDKPLSSYLAEGQTLVKLTFSRRDTCHGQTLVKLPCSRPNTFHITLLKTNPCRVTLLTARPLSSYLGQGKKKLGQALVKLPCLRQGPRQNILLKHNTCDITSLKARHLSCYLAQGQALFTLPFARPITYILPFSKSRTCHITLLKARHLSASCAQPRNRTISKIARSNLKGISTSL